MVILTINLSLVTTVVSDMSTSSVDQQHEFLRHDFSRPPLCQYSHHQVLAGELKVQVEGQQEFEGQIRKLAMGVTLYWGFYHLDQVVQELCVQML